MIGLPAALMITLALGSASDPEDSSQDTIDAISIRETKIDVVPASEAAKEPPNLDAPVAVPPAPLLSEHHDRSRDYLDPFLGRAIYPEISARFHTAFVRE